MGSRIGVGLLGLGTVGGGVASILLSPEERHPLVADLDLVRVAVRDLDRPRPVDLSADQLTTDPEAVVNDPGVDVVVEVIGGIEPARSLILKAIGNGKSVVTANKAVIARHGREIADAAAAAGVYVLIEAAVGGGIPIIEPLKQSLGGTGSTVSGIINGTTNYILTRMATEGVAYDDVLAEAQRLGYAEADPAADVDGLDAADKIAILAALAFGGAIDRSGVPTEGISRLQGRDVEYASQLGYGVKLLAVAERMPDQGATDVLPLSLRVQPTLVPTDHPLAGVNGVNNAILVEGDPIGRVMFYGPGAGAGPTASAVVADILNIAGVRHASEAAGRLDPLLAADSWRHCKLVDPGEVRQKHYVRFHTSDTPGVIGRIGSCFGDRDVSIQSIVQFRANEAGAEIVVITHDVSQKQMDNALKEIQSMPEISGMAAHLGCL